MLAQAGITQNTGAVWTRPLTEPSSKRDGNRVELSVTRHGSGEVPVVAVNGEIDVYAAPALRDGLTELLEDGSSVVVDLTDVGFLDSTGLGALVAARTTASEKGASLPLVCTHQRILKLFTITGLDEVFSIYDSVDHALAGLDARAETDTH
jgi:anti-sigma B factor antagonist